MTKNNRLATFAGYVMVLCVAATIYGWAAINNESIIGFSDSMDYLLMADFYSGWIRGQASVQAVENYAHTRFPPLLPLILALFDAGSHSQQTAASVSGATAVIACVAVFWWVRRASESPIVATLVAIALALYPAYFLLNLYPVSEPLTIALLSVVFGLLCRPTISINALWLAAALTGLLLLLRTAALPLIPALLVFLLFQPQVSKGRTAALVFLAAAPGAAWQLYRHALGSDSYASSLSLNFMLDRMGGFPDLIWLQPMRLFQAILENWRGDSMIAAQLATVLLLILAAFGWFKAFRSRHVDAFFLPLYVSMIVLWPYPDEFGRFFILVYPLILMYACSGMAVVFDWFSHECRRLPRARATIPVVLLVAVASWAAIVGFTRRALLPLEPSLLSYQREALFFIADTDRNAVLIANEYAALARLTDALPSLIPQGECVYMTSPQLAMLRSSVPATGYPEGLGEGRDGSTVLGNCNYFVLSTLTSRQANLPPFYPWQSLEGWTEIVASEEFAVDGRKALGAELLRRRHGEPSTIP